MLNCSRSKLGLKLSCVTAFSVTTLNVVSAQSMPQWDAWNTGSVFAAGMQCEGRGFMPEGQTVPVMAFTVQRLHPTDAAKVKDLSRGTEAISNILSRYGRPVGPDLDL